MISLTCIISLSYLIGSIPTSIILSRVLYGFDIRDRGSGNAGGTNAFRVLGWKAGVFVTALDIGKGIIATYLISQLRLGDLGLDQILVQMIAGTAATIGHIWTVFAGFRGGKGVGTAAGMIIVLYPLAVMICLIVFAIVLISSRYVSLSSISAALCMPLSLFLLDSLFDIPISRPLFIFAVLIAGLIIYTHRKNIQRLLTGSENRIKKIL